MALERWVRNTLWVSVPFNLMAAYGLWQPGSALGQILQAPTEVPAVYAALLGYIIAVFGVFYGHMAQQLVISRSLLLAAVVGKAGVFAILGLLWAGGEAPFLMFVAAWGDLALASIWAAWLWQTRNAS